MDIKFSFDANRIVQMAPFVSNEQTRYYLRGVLVQADPAGGVRLVATDGHAMAISRDPEGEYQGSESGLILATDGYKPFVSACRKKARSYAGKYLVECSGGAVHVRHTADPAPEYLHPAPFIDGTFPDYHRVVPQFKDENLGTDDTFNPELLHRFKGFGKSVTLYQEKKGSPIIVLTPDRDAFGVIMPMRGSNSLPEFWRNRAGAVEKEEAQAA